jgi:uncharacterized SAM-binding protein YcdF (DUF218 family)
MKRFLRILFHLAHGALLLLGLLALLFASAQFTNLPWQAYKHLSELPSPSTAAPTHILVMGGSGIPGKSGLMRTFFGAQAARLHPDATVLIAMPLGTAQSDASRAYLDEIRLRGIPSDRIRILDGGRNTREQALRLAEHLGSRTNTATILIVSDPEHIRRTAACLRRVGIPNLQALPTFALSIEDPLPWRAADLDAPGSAPAVRAAVPDIGSSLRLRYNLWTNLDYTLDALRERTALLYYRLRDWI